MHVQTLVRNINTGEIGVVVDDPWGVCGPWEVPVVYEGDTGFDATADHLLEPVGPEDAVADPILCGAGKGEDCCIFLMFGGEAGWTCQRFGPLRHTLLGRRHSMNAQREPVDLYPDCQIQPR